MTTLPTTPDTEYAVRQWLRTFGDAVVGEAVFFGIPDEVPSKFVTLGRIGGGPSSGTTPLDGARLSLSAWGTSKKEAGDIARALVDIFNAVEEEDIGNGVHVYGANVDLLLWQPAADTGRPRYIVDVTVHARTA